MESTRRWVSPKHGGESSGHKTFDRQCDIIMTGNVHSDCQVSSYVRPENKLDCNGYKFNHGELFNLDMNQFNSKGVPPYCIKIIRELTNTHNGTVVYLFRHWNKGAQFLHGIIVADRGNKHLRTIQLSSSQKSNNLMAYARKYVCID